jgi:protein N-terminal methyltransferase
VTRDVLLPLFDDVVLTEPVDKFVREARKSAEGWRDIATRRGEGGKKVWIIKEGLQKLDPARPADQGESLGVVGGDGKVFEGVYDV